MSKINDGGPAFPLKEPVSSDAVGMIRFRWFSERVDECLALGGDAALDALRKLIDEANADKDAGYGPPEHDINIARRKWLALYNEVYRRGTA